MSPNMEWLDTVGCPIGAIRSLTDPPERKAEIRFWASLGPLTFLLASIPNAYDFRPVSG